MAKSLSELPDECICIILSFLRPSQIKRLALICNKRLFEITKPYLEPLSKTRRDEVYFNSLFGEIDPDYYPSKLEDDLKYLTDLPISIPDEPRNHLEYLDLNDDLSWFEEIAREDQTKVWGVENEEDEEAVDKLIGITTRLGLTLPSSFIKLLKSRHLTDKLPTGMAWYIELSDLHKIRVWKGDDPSQFIDGYVFTWFSDQQGCYYTNMYLDKEGRHAVLGSPWAVVDDDTDSGEDQTLLPELTEEDRREAIRRCSGFIAKGQELYDVDFERWLVNHYYFQRIVGKWETEYSQDEIAVDGFVHEHIRRYVENVYTERGRLMQ